MHEEPLRAQTPILYRDPPSPGAPQAQTVTDSAALRVTSGGRAFSPADLTPIPLPPAAPDRLIQGKPSHLKMVIDLQKKFSNQLGFLPKVAIEQYLEKGLTGIAIENGEPCGYVLGRPSFRYQRQLRPITQAAVYMDAQRRHHGLALVDAVCRRALADGQLAVQASCAADIEAVEFWMTAGFLPIHDRELPNARGRQIIVFRRLITPTLPDWFFTPPPYAGHKARSAK